MHRFNRIRRQLAHSVDGIDQSPELRLDRVDFGVYRGAGRFRRFKRGGYLRPKASQQTPGWWRGFAFSELSDQMQAFFGPRCRHVEKTGTLGMVLALLDASQPSSDGVQLPGVRRRWSQKGGRPTVVVQSLVPIKRPAAVRRRLPAQTQKYHRVELQALGPVDGHNFDSALPGTVLARRRVIEKFLQSRRIVKIAPSDGARQDPEELLRVFDVLGLHHTPGAVQSPPRALHPPAEGLFGTRMKCQLQDVTRALQSVATVVAERGHPPRIIHQCPHRAVRVVPAQRVQVPPVQPAPGCP